MSRIFSKTPQWVTEFRNFIMRGNAVDLAIGVIIGAAFTTIVNSLVKDIFNPIIGLFIGGIDFSNIFITLKGPHVATLADAQKIGAVTLNVGVFINAVIQFLIVGLVIFWIVKIIGKAHQNLVQEQQASAPPLTKQEELLQDIRNILASNQTEAQRSNQEI